MKGCIFIAKMVRMALVFWQGDTISCGKENHNPNSTLFIRSRTMVCENSSCGKSKTTIAVHVGKNMWRGTLDETRIGIECLRYV